MCKQFTVIERSTLTEGWLIHLSQIYTCAAFSFKDRKMKHMHTWRAPSARQYNAGAGKRGAVPYVSICIEGGGHDAWPEDRHRAV